MRLTRQLHVRDFRLLLVFQPLWPDEGAIRLQLPAASPSSSGKHPDDELEDDSPLRSSPAHIHEHWYDEATSDDEFDIAYD